jgi:hypothetical protein
MKSCPEVKSGQEVSFVRELCAADGNELLLTEAVFILLSSTD